MLSKFPQINDSVAFLTIGKNSAFFYIVFFLILEFLTAVLADTILLINSYVIFVGVVMTVVAWNVAGLGGLFEYRLFAVG